MKKILNLALKSFGRIPVPVMIFILCGVTYGLLIPWLGFYMDDWYIILYQNKFSGGFSPFFYQDRPFFAYVYDVFVPIFKDSKLAWQIFVLFSHSLAVIVFWRLLNKLLPKRKTFSLIVSLLFLIYPGFQLHWFSVMYGQVYFLYAVYFLSYILMIDSLKAKTGKKWVLLLGAICCLIIGIVPQETFIGLEIARPIILWVVISSFPFSLSRKQKIKNFFIQWIPYVLVFLGFVIYRLGYSNSYSYQATLLSRFKNQPIDTILDLVGQAFWGLYNSLVRVWANLIDVLERDLLTPFSLTMLAVIVLGIGLSYSYLHNKSEEKEVRTQNVQIMIISLLVTLSAMTPFFAGGFKITLDFPANRYLIALAPGVCLFLIAFLDVFVKTYHQKIVIVAIIIGFSMGSHLITARSLMLSWKAQEDFFWELTWRAPDIRENTALVTSDIYFSKYISSTSLNAPLNLIYAPEDTTHQLPYLFILEAQQPEIIDNYESEIPINYSFRSFDFSGNTSSILVFTKKSGECLRILQPDNSTDEFLYDKRYSFWRQAVPLSNLDQIVVDTSKPATLPKKYFSSENRNQWCYYFEKADLSRQQQNWSEVINLYNEASQDGFKPGVESEWLPLLDAYVHVGDFEQAINVTKKITNHEKNTIAGFCRIWEEATTNEKTSSEASEMITWLQCN